MASTSSGGGLVSSLRELDRARRVSAEEVATRDRANHNMFAAIFAAEAEQMEQEEYQQSRYDAVMGFISSSDAATSEGGGGGTPTGVASPHARGQQQQKPRPPSNSKGGVSSTTTTRTKTTTKTTTTTAASKGELVASLLLDADRAMAVKDYGAAMER